MRSGQISEHEAYQKKALCYLSTRYGHASTLQAAVIHANLNKYYSVDKMKIVSWRSLI